MDLPEAIQGLKRLERSTKLQVAPISAMQREGLQELDGPPRGDPRAHAAREELVRVLFADTPFRAVGWTSLRRSKGPCGSRGACALPARLRGALLSRRMDLPYEVIQGLTRLERSSCACSPPARLRDAPLNCRMDLPEAIQGLTRLERDSCSPPARLRGALLSRRMDLP
eukprot:362935-Prorocentrum_minimum.AAC.1